MRRVLVPYPVIYPRRVGTLPGMHNRVSGPARLVLAGFLFLLVAVPARAEDEPAKSAPVPSAQRAADEVLAAVKARNDESLATLAARDNPDPWLVADELIARGEPAAALAFASARPRPAVEGLHEYLSSVTQDRPEEREILAKVNAALVQRAPARVIELTADLAEPCDSIARVRLS